MLDFYKGRSNRFHVLAPQSSKIQSFLITERKSNWISENFICKSKIMFDKDTFFMK